MDPEDLWELVVLARSLMEYLSWLEVDAPETLMLGGAYGSFGCLLLFDRSDILYAKAEESEMREDG